MQKRVFLPCAASRNTHRIAELRHEVKSSLQHAANADRRSIMNVGKVWRLPETRKATNEKTYFVGGLGKLRMQVKAVEDERREWAVKNRFAMNASRNRPGMNRRKMESPFPNDKRAHTVTRSPTRGVLRKSTMPVPSTSRMGAVFPPI